METRLRATAEQYLTLLEFMESNGDLSTIRGGPYGRIKADRLWFELGTKINSVPGGVHRAAEKWKRVWADWKTKTKKKAILIKRHESGIAGGPSSRRNLTTYEERVLAIMRKNVVSDQSIIREHGYSDPSQSLSSPPQAVTPPPATHQQDTTAFELAVSDESVAMSPPALETPPPSTSCQPPRSNISAQTSPPHRDLSASRRSKVEPALSAPSTPRSTSTRRSISTPGSRVTLASSSRMPRRVRRRRTVAPLDRTMGELVALKQQRLRMEEQRDRQLHERETRRIEVDHERNQILRSFADIARAWVDHCRNKGNTERMGSHQVTRRKEVDHERNQIMRSFADIARAWVDHYRSKDNTERLEN